MFAAAKIAVEVSKAPDKADKVIVAHGLDREQLREIMLEISADADLRAAYAEARVDLAS